MNENDLCEDSEERKEGSDLKRRKLYFCEKTLTFIYSNISHINSHL